jgi:hypothetical protein
MAATGQSNIALTTFVVATRDGQRIIRQGQIVAANDPAIKKHEELFAPYDPTAPSATA